MWQLFRMIYRVYTKRFQGYNKQVQKMQASNFEKRQETFGIAEPFSLMQRGLTSIYPYTDYIYVLDDWNNSEALKNLGFKKFRSELGQIISKNYKRSSQHRLDQEYNTLPQLLISSFQISLWNTISEKSIETFKPAWNSAQRNKEVHPQFSSNKKEFYKFDIAILFQIKKNKRGVNSLSVMVRNLIKKFGLSFYEIQGESRQFCQAQNAVIAGRFSDGVERPKDPYTFFLHCLLGYQNPQHLGGSYLLAQKCIMNWNNIHINNESLPGVFGRNDIQNGSSIFSQHHCPMSHIRTSRIKDRFGNPVTMYRDSKIFTTSSFEPEKERDQTDNINPQQGLFFIAYHKDPLLIEKIILNQLGNNGNPAFNDGLLNLFTVQHGNILYTPNVLELSDLKTFDNSIQMKSLNHLSVYHQTKWLKNYKKKLQSEQKCKITGNPFFLYSRAGYMVKMSQASADSELNPPSPRTLRILSKTFELWQDTWYYDRKQKQLEHLSHFIHEKPQVIDQLEQHANQIGFSFTQYKDSNGNWDYESIPMVVRNGLAIHFTLGHILSTYLYGCRGPIDGTPNGVFGANTFHLEPEDVLAGGETNLTFGQGKHVVEYLTQKQMEINWKDGINITAHSGVGHVVPYMEDIMNEGLGKMIEKIKNQVKRYSKSGDASKAQMFVSTVFALLGMKEYFINYSNYAQYLAKTLKPSQQTSIKSLQKIASTMLHLSTSPPRDLHEGAQLVLSTYICLHITGQPVSIGRLDHILRRFSKSIDPHVQAITLDQGDQDIIDSFWIKVGEKPNFNKCSFEDHQKFGNMAMGGNSNPFPQGASFNQWGQQLTIGGSNQDDSPFYNSITVHCLRAARTIPVNAPCLGLRLHPDTPRAIIQQAAKAILAGGAHPILLNDEKAIQGLRLSGNYVISREYWESTQLKIDGKVIDVPYNHWNTKVEEDHIRDYASDGCYQFLIPGRSWFSLSGGGCTLKPLQFVLNEGKNLFQSGANYMKGYQGFYKATPISEFKTYEMLQQAFFSTFYDIHSNELAKGLSNYGNMSIFCPATLLNAFTATYIERARDFYSNGTEYKLVCPQFTGIANLTNALWNIKKLVYERKVTNLQEIQLILQINWGESLIEPFISVNLPQNMKERQIKRCEALREIVWQEPKFGTDKQVTQFGLRISRKLSQIIRSIFERPSTKMLLLFKRLTFEHGSAQSPFGFQYLPGSGTFENFQDFGTDVGASFDGRKKGQTIAQDYSPQNYLVDKTIGDKRYDFKPVETVDIIDNYSFKVGDMVNPFLFSGAVLDLNIDEDYDYEALVEDIASLASGKGTNLTTITCCSRQVMEELLQSTEQDLIRFRMGGWSQFAISMFPKIFEQEIRRVRQVPSKVASKHKCKAKKDMLGDTIEP